MPIGIVSDDAFLQELNRVSSTPSKLKEVEPSPVITPEIVELERPGRNDGDNNVPDSLRQIIGEEAVINGRQSAIGLAGMFGISSSSVSAYAKGATSTASINTPSATIVKHINKARERATKKAGKVLNSALNAITQDKLDFADATDLSGIAKDMSVIIKNLEPQADPLTDQSGAARPQYVIFAPTFRDERSYESISVNE